MEIVRTLEKTDVHRALTALATKSTLGDEHKQDLANQQKGYEGEKNFNSFLEKRACTEGLVLNNLVLEVRGSKLQIDTLVIAADVVYLYEVKNYSGEYKMEAGILYTLSGYEVDSPINQLERTASRLRQLLQLWRVNMKVEATIIFVHPKCILYHADPSRPIVMHSQIEKHLEKINASRRPVLNRHRRLADKLRATIKEGVIYREKLPAYSYEDLKKKLTCEKCTSFDIVLTQRSSTCLSCHHNTTIEKQVIHQVEEFKLLFPDKKVTRNIIYDWCGGVISDQRIYKILKNNYSKQGNKNGTHYI